MNVQFADLLYAIYVPLTAPDRRMGLWETPDAGRASAQASASLGANSAGTGSRTDQVGESGEETGAGYQEERQEWPNRRLQDPG